jgi:hypothetical protein
MSISPEVDDLGTVLSNQPFTQHVYRYSAVSLLKTMSTTDIAIPDVGTKVKNLLTLKATLHLNDEHISIEAKYL